MSYLPGVPDDSPAPVSPVVGAAKIGAGHVTHIAAVAHAAGKPGRVEYRKTVVGHPGKGSSHVGGGKPIAHMMNHYGKKGPEMMGADMPTAVDPTQHPGVRMMRGSAAGRVEEHVRQGGLGPGRMSTPGKSGNYSQTGNGDSE